MSKQDDGREDAESLIYEAQYQAVLQVLIEHPEWTLAQLSEVIEARGPFAKTLACLSVRALADASIPTHQQPHRFAVYRVLQTIGGWVSASRLQSLMGGDRVRMRSTLRKLVDVGKVERRGQTSAVMYRAVLEEEEESTEAPEEPTRPMEPEA